MTWVAKFISTGSVMTYELMSVPVALAEMNLSLRTGQKSVSANLITSGIICPCEIELHKERKARGTATDK